MKYTEEDITNIIEQDIIRFFRQGYNLVEIAEITEWSVSKIKTFLKNENLLKHRPVKKLKFPEEKIVQEYLNGKNINALSYYYCTHQSIITGILTKYGVLTKYKYAGKICHSHGQLNALRKQINVSVQSMYEKNTDLEKIAQKNNISLASVRKIIGIYLGKNKDFS
jgi:predicted DNA-binding protein YlxM (UPF0122 family)